MFRTIAERVPRDPDDPARAQRLDTYARMRDGTLYDVLPYQFHEERTGLDEYVPLRERAPSVRSGLCRTVVDDSVSLLFGEGRFPALHAEDPVMRNALALLAQDLKLAEVMTRAAILGSVGSVALRLRVIRGRAYVDALETTYLTPVWDPEAPDTLLHVTERRKVSGAELRASGYDIAAEDLQATFWFERCWDRGAEIWMQPLPLADAMDGAVAAIDPVRSLCHGLGFVPLIWIRNLPGGDEIDGECTFRAALDTVIEIDYQLSQAGRGLKYSSDPTLLIKEPASPGEEMIKGGGNAIVVSEAGDAKLLEIGGTASAAVIDYVRMLRDLALESIHGNRALPDRLAGAQSGRALEMLYAPLLAMVDHLRSSYGDDGLLPLMQMILAAARKLGGLKLRNGQRLPLADVPLSLRWGPWFPLSPADAAVRAGALVQLKSAGLISVESAVQQVADDYDIADLPAELARIDAETGDLR